MRLSALCTVLVSVCALAACGDNIPFEAADANPSADAANTADGAIGRADAQATGDYELRLRVDMSGFFDGDTLYVDLRADANDTVSVASTDVVIDSNTEVDVRFDNALTDGVDYTLFYWADRNDDGDCDEPLSGGNDRGWAVAIPAPTDDVEIRTDSGENRIFRCAP